MKGLGRNPDSWFKKGEWLWCFHCERVFKFDGNYDCIFTDCDGGAMDIRSWDGVRIDQPGFPEEPEFGRKYSLYY